MVVGIILWIARMTHLECKTGVHYLSKVLSRPSKIAWNAAMHMLSWLDQNRTRGIMFRSDGCDQLEASVDSSNKQDTKDGQVMFGYCVHLAGGPIIAETGKLKNSGFGTPAVEFMAMASSFASMTTPTITKDQENDAALLSNRWTQASIVWLRQLLEEASFGKCCRIATTVKSDNSGAIDWMRFRKITPGNNYVLLSYHQQREWHEMGFVTVEFQRGVWNLSDILTKAVTRQVIQTLLLKFLGYELAIPGEIEDDPKTTEAWMKTLKPISTRIAEWTLK